MKKRILTLAAALALTVQCQAGWLDTIGNFFAANPTNQWDLSSYAVKDVTLGATPTAYGLGGGARIAYWVDKSIGAALDANYCDSSWTFASLALAGRGTFDIGSTAKFTPYVTAGPGWNIRGPSQTVVAVAGGGGTLSFTKLPKVAFFGEFVTVLNDTSVQRVQAGVTFRF